MPLNTKAADETILDGGNADLSKCGNCVGSQTTATCKQYCGDYQLNDFVVILVKVSKIILALSGSLALIAFIIGGYMFLLSGGNSNMVERGKLTLIGAVIGLIIVFTSFLAINTIMTSLGIENWNIIKTSTK